MANPGAAAPPTVAVITGTTGSPLLAGCIRSVQEQTYPHVEHWVIVDGAEHLQAACAQFAPNTKFITLPENTGGDGFVCHRIVGSIPWLVSTDYVCFLDEDNEYEPHHIQSLLESLPEGGRWAHSLRVIVDEKGDVVCGDDCESLGGLAHTVLGPRDRLVDTNTYLIERLLAIQASPLWNVKARQEGELEADRAVCRTLLGVEPLHGVSRTRSVKYRVGNRTNSVQAQFFIDGNSARDLDFAAKDDIYLFHFTPEATSNALRQGKKNYWDEWAPTLPQSLRKKYNVLDGFANVDFLPVGARILIVMWHPSALPMELFEKRPDLRTLCYTLESPNIRHKEQWQPGFLKTFKGLLTYWLPLLRNPPDGTKPFFCPHNTHPLNGPAEFPQNTGQGRSVVIVLERRDLAGTYPIGDQNLTCLDFLRSEYVEGLNDITCYGLGWDKYIDDPIVKVGHSLPRTKDPRSSIEIMKNFTFALIVENCDAPGYVSEKFYDALIAGCFPLYYGNMVPELNILSDMYLDLKMFQNGTEVQAFLDRVPDATLAEWRQRIVDKRERILRTVDSDAFATRVHDAFCKI